MWGQICEFGGEQMDRKEKWRGLWMGQIGFQAAEMGAFIMWKTDCRINVCVGKTTTSTLTGFRSLTGNVCRNLSVCGEPVQ